LEIYAAREIASGHGFSSDTAWQQELEESSRPLTAFTHKGHGSYQWVVTPMGLTGSPSSFARLMDHIMGGLDGAITYIDDVLIHSVGHDNHLDVPRKGFERLRKFGLKLNAEKCQFGAREVSYLGYRLTDEGILPGFDKTKAVREMKEPDTVKKIREFTGLTNYFRQFIPNYARVAGKLTMLTRKDNDWKGGKLPPDSLLAFNYLKECLCKAPVLVYPKSDRLFTLSTDAATGDELNPGGLGAILSQADDQGRDRVIGYASRALQMSEKNYSPFLLEMKATTWAIDYFSVYLRGRKFIVLTDHRPVEAVSRLHRKTLNRLQELNREYDFTVGYRPGPDNAAADALSRNTVDALEQQAGLSTKDLQMWQHEDPLCMKVGAFLQTGELPGNKQEADSIRAIGHCCLIKDGVIRYTLARHGFDTRLLVLTPQVLRAELVKAAHVSRFSGHGGQFRTVQILTRAYWWPGLTADVERSIQSCTVCLACKNPVGGTRVPLQPLEALTRPNHRVHIDLFGPLKCSTGGHKYVMVITDAFTKYTELVAIKNKEATTVAKAFLDHWVCRFSAPTQILTDQGKEFVNSVSEDLLRMLDITRLKTSALHPMTNSSAESFNREIIRYLSRMLTNKTLDWEEWLPMLAISYNTQIHRTTLQSPFFLTFLHEPNLPYFDMEESRPNYGESWPVEAYMRLRKSYKAAHEETVKASDTMKRYYDKDVQERKFQLNDDVMVHYPRSAAPPGGNAKFLTPWRDNWYVHQRLGPDTYWVRERGKRTQGSIVHAVRLKQAVVQHGGSPEAQTDIQRVVKKPASFAAPALPPPIRTEGPMTRLRERQLAEQARQEEADIYALGSTRSSPIQTASNVQARKQQGKQSEEIGDWWEAAQAFAFWNRRPMATAAAAASEDTSSSSEDTSSSEEEEDSQGSMPELAGSAGEEEEFHGWTDDGSPVAGGPVESSGSELDFSTPQSSSQQIQISSSEETEGTEMGPLSASAFPSRSVFPLKVKARVRSAEPEETSPIPSTVRGGVRSADRASRTVTKFPQPSTSASYRTASGLVKKMQKFAKVAQIKEMRAASAGRSADRRGGRSRLQGVSLVDDLALDVFSRGPRTRSTGPPPEEYQWTPAVPLEYSTAKARRKKEEEERDKSCS